MNQPAYPPRVPVTLFLRPDLTFLITVGDQTLEICLEPTQALELAEELELRAFALMGELAALRAAVPAIAGGQRQPEENSK